MLNQILEKEENSKLHYWFYEINIKILEANSQMGGLGFVT